MFRKFIFTVATIVLVVSIIPFYSKFFATTDIGRQNHTIESNPNSPVSIAYISDLYLRDDNIEYIEKIASKLNSNNPDIVIIGGNLIEDPDNFNSYPELISGLKSIRAPYGKFSYYDQTNYTVDQNDFIDYIYYESDIQVLTNTVELYIGNNVPEVSLTPVYSDEQFIDVNEELFNIALIGDPDFFDQMEKASFDLVISSGNLGGVYNLPFKFIEEKVPSSIHQANRLIVKDGTQYIVSNGIGLPSQYAMRIFNKPKITFINLK